MKKLFAFILSLFISIVFVLAQGGSTSRLETDRINSGILNTEKEFIVYLPVGYDDSQQRYPVLYLLHGAGDTYAGWTQKGNAKNIADRLIAEGMALPMIIVMPDASGGSGKSPKRNMGYFNRPDWNYEDHFFKELMPYVEKKYRIKPEKNARAIAGLSMGGGGAMSYALHHPEMFGSCCPLSGLLGDSRRVHTRYQDAVYRESIEANDPHEIIKKASEADLGRFRTVRWYIDCGDDDFLAESNVEMYLLMREKKIPLEYRMRDGIHNWEYWQTGLNEVLRFISIGFK